MSYEVHICSAIPQTLAVVRGRANASNIGTRITADLLPEVWKFLRATGVENSGLNIVVYHGEEAGGCFDSEAGLMIEAGVITGPFVATPPVERSAIPSGLIARALHVGPYDQLPQPHFAVRQWCRENGLALTGLNWEIYGHWKENPQDLQTEVCYGLKE